MKYLSLSLVILSFILFSCSVGTTLKEDSYLVINVLDKKFYKDCHIKGSIHVPFDLVTLFAKKIENETPIVVYCSNYACSASGMVRDQLKAMGFANVKAYEGGMAEWYQMDLPVEGPALQSYLSGDNPRPDDYQDDENHIVAESLQQEMVKNNLL